MTDWTDKKRGYSGDRGNLGSHINPMSFNRKTRELLGDLFQTKDQRVTPDGNVMVKAFGMYEKFKFDPLKKEAKKNLISVYYPPSEIAYADLAPKTTHYWRVLPTASLSEVAESIAVCLPSPQRILTDTEVKVIKAMGKNRKVFIFPGTDVDIYNEVLDQIECIFEIIPFTTTPTGGISGILPNGNLIYLPMTYRGWLRVRDKYASLALVKDPYNKGFAFNNIIHVFPTFSYPKGSGGVYETGYVINDAHIQLTTDHYDGAAYGFKENSLYPDGFITDDWSTLSKAAVLAWLNSVLTYMPYIKKTEATYTIHRNAQGRIDFTDTAEFDWISATLAYYTGDGIMTAGFTPYWLTSAYDTTYDTVYTTKEFSEWWAYQEWGTTDRLAQYFYNMPPYILYDDTYIPPIQS